MKDAAKILDAAASRLDSEVKSKFLEPEKQRKKNKREYKEQIKTLQGEFDAVMENAKPRLEDDERSRVWNRMVLDYLMFKAEAAFAEALMKGLKKVGKKKWNAFRGPIINTVRKLANDAASPDGWLAKRLENPSVADADVIKAFIAEAFGLEPDAIPMGWTSMMDELAVAMEEMTKGIRGYLPAGPEGRGLLEWSGEVEQDTNVEPDGEGPERADVPIELARATAAGMGVEDASHLTEMMRTPAQPRVTTQEAEQVQEAPAEAAAQPEPEQKPSAKTKAFERVREPIGSQGGYMEGTKENGHWVGEVRLFNTGKDKLPAMIEHYDDLGRLEIRETMHSTDRSKVYLRTAFYADGSSIQTMFAPNGDRVRSVSIDVNGRETILYSRQLERFRQNLEEAKGSKHFPKEAIDWELLTSDNEGLRIAEDVLFYVKDLDRQDAEPNLYKKQRESERRRSQAKLREAKKKSLAKQEELQKRRGHGGNVVQPAPGAKDSWEGKSIEAIVQDIRAIRATPRADHTSPLLEAGTFQQEDDSSRTVKNNSNRWFTVYQTLDGKRIGEEQEWQRLHNDKAKDYLDDFLTLVGTTRYDENGNAVEMLRYDPDGRIHGRERFRSWRDENGEWHTASIDSFVVDEDGVYIGREGKTTDVLPLDVLDESSGQAGNVALSAAMRATGSINSRFEDGASVFRTLDTIERTALPTIFPDSVREALADWMRENNSTTKKALVTKVLKAIPVEKRFYVDSETGRKIPLSNRAVNSVLFGHTSTPKAVVGKAAFLLAIPAFSKRAVQVYSEGRGDLRFLTYVAPVSYGSITAYGTATLSGAGADLTLHDVNYFDPSEKTGPARTTTLQQGTADRRGYSDEPNTKRILKLIHDNQALSAEVLGKLHNVMRRAGKGAERPLGRPPGGAPEGRKKSATLLR